MHTLVFLPFTHNLAVFLHVELGEVWSGGVGEQGDTAPWPRRQPAAWRLPPWACGVPPAALSLWPPVSPRCSFCSEPAPKAEDSEAGWSRWGGFVPCKTLRHTGGPGPTAIPAQTEQAGPLLGDAGEGTPKRSAPAAPLDGGGHPCGKLCPGPWSAQVVQGAVASPAVEVLPLRSDDC